MTTVGQKSQQGSWCSASSCLSLRLRSRISFLQAAATRPPGASLVVCGDVGIGVVGMPTSLDP